MHFKKISLKVKVLASLALVALLAGLFIVINNNSTSGSFNTDTKALSQATQSFTTLDCMTFTHSPTWRIDDSYQAEVNTTRFIIGADEETTQLIVSCVKEVASAEELTSRINEQTTQNGEKSDISQLSVNGKAVHRATFNAFERTSEVFYADAKDTGVCILDYSGKDNDYAKYKSEVEAVLSTLDCL